MPQLEKPMAASAMGAYTQEWSCRLVAPALFIHIYPM
jgi:hypothetical protein